MNASRAMYWLLAAVRHSQRACARVRAMVANAIAKLFALLAIERAAA